MKLEPLPAVCIVLMLPEVDEVVTQAVKGETARRMSKNNLKKLARAFIPELKPSDTTTLLSAVANTSDVHREKLAPMGDQLNPLIA